MGGDADRHGERSTPQGVLASDSCHKFHSSYSMTWIELGGARE